MALDPNAPNPTPSVIPFQYNPASLSRKLEVQSAGGNSSWSEVFRLKGAPIETLSLEVEFDATDALEQGDENATSMGVYPQLSALEVLLYPDSEAVVDNARLAEAGGLEIIPASGPYTLFVWGKRRVVPVRVTDFSVTEEAFDTNLNPTRARVALSLRVLSYADFAPGDQGYALFQAHHVNLEARARKGTVNSFDGIVGGTLDQILAGNAE